MDQSGKVWGGREMGARVEGQEGQEGGGGRGSNICRPSPLTRVRSHCPSTCYGKQEDPQLKPGMFQGAASTSSRKTST